MLDNLPEMRDTPAICAVCGEPGVMHLSGLVYCNVHSQGLVAETTCYQCGSPEPMADKLGWLELGYSSAPHWRRRFCGGSCLNTWSTTAMERLTRAVLGETQPD